MADPDQDDADVLDNDQEGSFCEDGVRRPMNAFFIFCKRHRDVVREKYPHLENRSITKILGEWWANLDGAEKSSYTALAKQYKEAFMKAHPDFKWYKLPSVPTRTLITRPSNNRLQMAKKDKNGSKSNLCGIALGKLADDEQLGGLSSLLLNDSMDLSAQSADGQDASTTVTSSSLCNISKPPKKRYLVNGEFKCKPESYDSRDDQTQNACSALMELAEICVNTANHSISSTKSSDGLCNSSTFSPGTYPDIPLYKSALSLKNMQNNVVSSENHDTMVGTTFAQAGSSTMFTKHDNRMNVPELQEQPLDLCKQKGTMFTTSNQQLIDHLVDKFLCEPVSPMSESQVSEFNSSPMCNKIESSCQSFTLSAAIESAIDQAYSRNPPQSDVTNTSSIKVATTTKVLDSTSTKSLVDNDSDDKTEVVFIDKIKKACLASSRKAQEKPLQNQSSYSRAGTNSTWVEPDSSVSILERTKQVVLPNQPEPQFNRIPKKETKFSSSKYYSKFASPPKKSQVWCNLFMREQLENSDSEGSVDAKKATGYDLASPVRRNSQRTCKGRRYQELITEGLLQSTKERKPGAGRKPFAAIEKSKGKSSSLSDSPLTSVKSKKKKSLVKSKSLEKEEDIEEGSDMEKSVFDLNEKIASLPKCSLETLNKKRKLNSSSKCISTGKDMCKISKESIILKVQDVDQISSKTRQDSASRYKTGSFDLEQHIASLPKCDIEVLNKRKNKKE